MTFGSEFAAVGFGLAASLSWGMSDFSGGFASKRAHVFGVMIVSYGVGLIPLIALAVAAGEPWLAPRDLAFAAAAGLAGATGLTAFYQALAVGRMGIVAPLSALLGAVVPVLFSAIVEGLPGTAQIAGFAVALVSVWLVSRPAENAQRQTTGLGLATLAGLGFGCFFILIDQVSNDATFWPLATARGISLVVMSGGAALAHAAWHPPRRALPIILVAGTLDVSGNVFFLLAAHAGRLDVASVVSSLYPAVTVVLARSVLKETLSSWQVIGIGAALVAIPLIAV